MRKSKQIAYLEFSLLRGSMDIRWIAVGIAIVGVGVNVATKMLKLTPEREKFVGRLGLVLIGIGILGILYGFYAGTKVEDAKSLPSITQMNMNSPGGLNVGRDFYGNYTYNPEVNPNAPVVAYSYNGWRITTRNAPVFEVITEEETPQAAAFKIVGRLEDGKNWFGLKSLCEEETKKTLEWLTPPLFCCEAYLNLGLLDEAIERVEYVQRKAAGREDYKKADQIRNHIRETFRK